MSELATLQRWLTSIIIRPGALQDKILAADRTYGIDNTEAIRSSPEVSRYERIQIYARGYVLRLMECIHADYPVLRNLLGEELFDTFARAYLVHVPSGSYSLYDLGGNFPAFLKASRPNQANFTPEEQKQFDLPVELALLERARAEVYRSKGTETNSRDVEHDPVFFVFGSESLSVPPCLRLLELQFPLIGFIQAVERGETPPVPPARTSFTAVGRKNYVVHMQELEPWQWHFLKALAETGDQTQAVAASARINNLPEDALWADLMLWIPAALDFGYIHRQ